tara:strand:+ start:142 stop:522 length:381 start_codon:yes stop_codon:yes gene_type:complete
MASYAELNEDNVVLRVVKISNDIMLDSFGNEQEGLGLAECQKIFGGGTWIQCSASGAFRRRFPSIGSVYDKSRDAFLPPKQYSNFVLDETTLRYVPPVPYPDDGNIHVWNLSTNRWELGDPEINVP